MPKRRKVEFTSTVERRYVLGNLTEFSWNKKIREQRFLCFGFASL